MSETQRDLGRVYMPNPGSQHYPLRPKLARSALRATNWKTKRWQMGTGLKFQDQGWTSRCVEYGCTHILMIEAIVRKNAFAVTKGLYEWAQKNDFWEGEDYDGTSVDAGLQFLLHQAKVISEYRWVRSMDEVLARLSANAPEGGGPIVVGTDWYTGMDNLNGEAVWSPDGSYRGGHCYTLIGHLSPTAKRARKIVCGNSHDGNYIGTIDADAMEWLLFAQNGEGAAITELPRAA